MPLQQLFNLYRSPSQQWPLPRLTISSAELISLPSIFQHLQHLHNNRVIPSKYLVSRQMPHRGNRSKVEKIKRNSNLISLALWQHSSSHPRITWWVVMEAAITSWWILSNKWWWTSTRRQHQAALWEATVVRWVAMTHTKTWEGMSCLSKWTWWIRVTLNSNNKCSSHLLHLLICLEALNLLHLSSSLLKCSRTTNITLQCLLTGSNSSNNSHLELKTPTPASSATFHPMARIWTSRSPSSSPRKPASLQTTAPTSSSKSSNLS